MLKGVDPLLPPELLLALAQMGHGDSLALVDRNFPAASTAQRVIRLAGCDLPTAAAAILTVLPVDRSVDQPVAVMHQGDGSAEMPAVQREVLAIAEDVEERQLGVEELDRFSFYARAREAFAVVITGERRAYGCLLLTKGVLS